MFFKGRQVRSGGHGFCGIGRKRLLNILQERCLELGVDLVFETDATDDQALAAQYKADLVIASDGLNSRIRQRYAEVYQPDIDLRQCRFVWLGTHQTFDAFTFAFEQTEHGWFQAHAYQFDDKTSTFIVETPEAVWQAHGLDKMEQPEAIAFCEKLFAKYLDGHSLISNATHLRGSANWIRFPRVVCKHWTHRVDVDGKHGAGGADGRRRAHGALLDRLGHQAGARRRDRPGQRIRAAAATSTTCSKPTRPRRSVEVLKIQNAARNSTEWFENVPRYTGMEIEQFAYSLLTRSQRISHENLRLRDTAVAGRLRAVAVGRQAASPPMLMPLTVRGLDAQEPHRRVADGHLQRGRRRAAGFPAGAPGRPRARRRRDGVGRDDQPDARRPHHAGLHRALQRRAAGGLQAHRRLRARAVERQDRHAAGPQRPQGLDPGRLGRHRRAACRRATGRCWRPARWPTASRTSCRRR